MATPDKTKVQRLTDMDFSLEGCHIALVDKAANGKEQPLVLKSLEPIEKGEFFDGDDESMSDLRVDMSLEDMLRVAFGIWGPEARLVANSVVKNLNEESVEEIRNELVGMITTADGSASGAAASGAPAPLVAKNDDNDNEEIETMSDDKTKQPEAVLKAEDVQEMVQKALDSQKAEFEKQLADRDGKLEAFEKAEAERQDVKYATIAKKYESLGANEETGAVLKALATAEGVDADAIFKMLDTALDTVKKADKLETVGADGSPVNVDSMNELKTVAKSLQEAEGLTEQQAMVKAAEQNPHLIG